VLTLDNVPIDGAVLGVDVVSSVVIPPRLTDLILGKHWYNAD